MAQPQGNPKQVDPNVPLPPAIRRQKEETERMIAAVNGGTPQDTPQPPQDAPQPAPAPQDAPQPPQPAPQPQAGPQLPQDAPQPPQEQPQGGNDETWEQRYNSEKGRTRKLQKQLTDMAETVAGLEQLIATMQTQAPPAPAPEQRFESLLTPEEEREWGEALPIIEKKAREIVAPLEAELRGKLKQLDEQLGRVGQSQVQGAKAQMIQALDSHALIGLGQDHHWRDLNENDAFVDWLQQVDRRSGRTLQALLREAFSSNNAPRVASFFEDFLKEVAPSAAPPREPSPPADRGKVSLEALAAPGGAPRSAAPPAGPAEKPIYTSGDISKFYADKTAGRYRGREDEAKRIEADIVAAGREGRVKPGAPQQR